MDKSANIFESDRHSNFSPIFFNSVNEILRMDHKSIKSLNFYSVTSLFNEKKDKLLSFHLKIKIVNIWKDYA